MPAAHRARRARDWRLMSAGFAVLAIQARGRRVANHEGVGVGTATLLGLLETTWRRGGLLGTRPGSIRRIGLMGVIQAGWIRPGRRAETAPPSWSSWSVRRSASAAIIQRSRRADGSALNRSTAPHGVPRSRGLRSAATAKRSPPGRCILGVQYRSSPTRHRRHPERASSRRQPYRWIVYPGASTHDGRGDSRPWTSLHVPAFLCPADRKTGSPQRSAMPPAKSVGVAPERLGQLAAAPRKTASRQR